MASSFEKHPALTFFLFFMALFVLIGGIAEIALRFVIPYDIGYYAAVRKPGVYDYPYGKIYMNEDGYPDEAFDRNSVKKRIGYFGDSVIFGVGAGAGYRLSDLLQDRYPDYEHWTFSMIANGVQGNEVADKAREYGLDTVVYGFNLNDILPEINAPSGPDGGKPSSPPLLYRAQGWIENHIDGTLRGRSYLYNGLRTLVKNALTRLGYSHTGFKAAELYPSENEALIRDVAERVNALDAALARDGVTFCVILLPYEMQISRDAAQTYRELGIHWEDGFEDGSTQRLLKRYLKVRHLYDGRDAFDGLADTAKIGEYFVYNKGDKIDFNHPNRAGHALLAKDLLKSNDCPAYNY